MTTTHTHTSGPWTIEAPSKGCAFPIIHGGSEYSEIAIVYSGDADKCLIASAPELLAALKDAEAMLFLLGKEHEETGGIEYNADFISGTRNDLLLAIAKAEGGDEP